MLEDRSIDILAYNLETVLAEKLETIIRRTTTNTRMRDFYDLYILKHSYKDELSSKILHDALEATSYRRGSEQYLNQANEVFVRWKIIWRCRNFGRHIGKSFFMQQIWSGL